MSKPHQMTVDEVIADIERTKPKPRAKGVKLAKPGLKNVPPEQLRPAVLPGYATARATIMRCREPKRRERMLAMLELAGVRGGPAFDYFVGLARFHVDAQSYPTPPLKLSADERRYVEARVQALLKGAS